MFLRRKPTTQMGPQLPNMPTINSSLTTTPPSDPTKQNPATQMPQSTAAKIDTVPGKVIQATTTKEMPPIYEPWLSQTTLNSGTQNKPESNPSLPIEQSQDITTHLSRISETGKKVQALEASLKVEKEQLNKEITGLNKVLEEQERAVRKYFDSIRQAVAAINTQSGEVNQVYNSPPAEVNDLQNPPPKEEDNKPSVQQTERSDTTQNQIINTQPFEAKTEQDTQLTQINYEQNPPSTNNDNKQNMQQTDQSNASQDSMINNQALQVDNNQGSRTEAFSKENSPQTEINNKQNIQPKQNIADKNAKKPQPKNRRQERTQEEDIKIAEHTKED
jgi:hypothetical protein